MDGGMFPLIAMLQPAADAPGPAGASAETTRLLINLAYLLAAALFIFGLKRLSHPKTARNGNRLSAFGMLIAIAVTLGDREIIGYWTILAGVVVGSGVGAVLAARVQMTAMPQMVGLLNGFGGLASATVALGEYLRARNDVDITPRADTLVTMGLSVLIGMVTFTGSLMAFGKLQGLKFRGRSLGNPVTFSMQHALNAFLLAFAVGMIVFITRDYEQAVWAVVLLYLVAAVLGVLVVVPIGGADMPVVISLLNSYSGLAAMTTGFALDNYCLIITGSLVGASGIILTKIMCNAMNRSLVNVIAGGFGQEASVPGATQATGGLTVRQMDAEEAAMVLEAAQSVAIVPGYGMAVAQAQHKVAELARVLGQKGVTVKFAIHPVAGRMPGHMNVLLAEANVPYESLYDLELNSELPQTDVALVIGANDVVNPAARDEPGNPIYGMPIFNVDRCKTVMVCKRSLNPGFAGIENPLFFLPNTTMLFGDAKTFISDVVKCLSGQD
jgi:NAD(P) transhydrogenase subunit beta